MNILNLLVHFVQLVQNFFLEYIIYLEKQPRFTIVNVVWYISIFPVQLYNLYKTRHRKPERGVKRWSI